MAIKSLAVFCGSKGGKDPLFVEHARQLGYILAENNITLIYGGGNKGMMGTIATAVMEKDGKVTGIMPKLLTEWEHQHLGITELLLVSDMHTRKRMLYERCDAALILAGGYGTLDELFEMLTWNQLNIHDKQIYVLNTAGFYDHLLAHIRKMEDEGFLYEHLTKKLIVVNTPAELSFE